MVRDLYTHPMKTYLVGGAVRDQLLGYPYHERDWVVVGATPNDMLDKGFRPVGKDFPVFLHPDTAEEYALARTERKSGPGYSGFTFHTAPNITLEQDLARRDLTINAMSMDSDGNLIDPYGGQEDLQHKVLRHVGEAFVEDPVRILRVARFAARYHHLGFRVANETTELMKSIVASGEASHLVAERVWKECEKALQERSPHVFIRTLRECHALAVIMPELDQLFGVPQPPAHHPEIDCGVHALLSLQAARALTNDTAVLLAALIHDLGKGTTAREEWPRHIAHEARSLPLIKQFCERMAVPKQHRELSLAVAQDHTNCHRAFELKASTLFNLLQRLDAFRRPEKLQRFVLACTADARGRTGFEQTPYPQGQYLLDAQARCAAVEVQSLIKQGFKGKALGDAIQKNRIQALHALIEQTAP